MAPFIQDMKLTSSYHVKGFMYKIQVAVSIITIITLNLLVVLITGRKAIRQRLIERQRVLGKVYEERGLSF